MINSSKILTAISGFLLIQSNSKLVMSYHYDTILKVPSIQGGLMLSNNSPHLFAKEFLEKLGADIFRRLVSFEKAPFDENSRYCKFLVKVFLQGNGFVNRSLSGRPIIICKFFSPTFVSKLISKMSPNSRGKERMPSLKRLQPFCR